MTWQEQSLPADHPAVKSGGVGVLLVNLGTPDAPEKGPVKRYLAEFLSDRRVVEIPAIAWQPILRGIILNTRPKKSAHAYRQVWTEEGSPLAVITRDQTAAMQQRLGDEVKVDWAMRYGTPSIPERIEALMAAGCERILLAPLYPQYSGATTATVVDKAADKLREMRWQASLRTLPPYHDDPAYIDALCASLKDSLSKLDFEPDVLLMSYHGIPKSYFDKGDPYHCHCHKTTRLVREKMGWDENFIRTTFQSRFGPQEWLQPYTDKTLEALPEDGVKKVAVAAPAFISDCLETLEEIAMEGRDSFLEAGGEEFASLPCLNDSDIAIDLLETLVKRELGGWV